ncbi:magnesium-translocating P-type ATPase [Aeromicrobium wangtongii]|uniref:Magnesium-transporting ATPase, P-type 1 n=1 Tax=Aeromicrobium wangtongii TaxID=2969247 RepID=A0ABY5MDZ1_9ACTN|nr:magnesium-translocating P-type ATPase [Aeromicrobium wangtongii]MCD9197460.1 magnesium-translocating P-type ATPase [Aeromicrobium wangtongii]UUP14952.1 magnesium-translocating P-type ATPase [Aeromicrobium wangtongii]
MPSSLRTADDGSTPGQAVPAFWSRSADEVLTALGSSTGGLTTQQADAALEGQTSRRSEATREASSWHLLLRQFVSPIELILVAATVLSGILGDWTDAGIILVILVLSGVLGFVQERNAGKAMKALLASVEVTAQVLRDGERVAVAMDEVVPGDVAVLSAGDLVPGDCLVLTSRELVVDESALTGETFPVEKRPGIIPAAAAIAERANEVFLGTHVSSGTATVVVVHTGAHTEIAAVSARLRSPAPRTGFERGMTAFGLLLGRVMLVFAGVILLLNIALDRSVLDSVLFALALAVGVTPQLLPAIVSISLAQGARAMARQRVIVRRLDVIEDFGAMRILCSDKTGTMTQGRIELGAALTHDGADSATVAELAALNAGLQQGWKNPIDEAIIRAHPPGADAEAIDELPYDFRRKRLSVLVRRGGAAEPVVVTKGALADVLAVCTEARTSTGTVPLDEAAGQIQQTFATLSAGGFRVLGVAMRPLRVDQLQLGDEAHMTFMGLLTFADPVKPDAAATVADLVDAGVSVRMVTGDNRLVAAHVAAAVGLDISRVWTGADIDDLDDAALAAALQGVEVFSEMNPLQKERVVHAFRATGEVVGYLGDGINDAPSLHAADVGISVDTAVPVAKQSAAIVLLDKDLGVLLHGVRQGRQTFANTMKYIFMTTSANFGNVLSMAFAAVTLPFLPLLAGQILLVNLLTDLPAATIATDRVDAEQLRRPREWNTRLIGRYMLVFGSLSTVFDLTTFVVLRVGFDADATEFRSAWFVGSVLTEVGVLFVLRTRHPFFRSRPSGWLVLASVVVAAVAVALPYSDAAGALGLERIPAGLLAVVVLITVGYLAATEVMKRFFWRTR